MKNKEKSSRSGLSLEEGDENIIANVGASKILHIPFFKRCDLENNLGIISKDLLYYIRIYLLCSCKRPQGSASSRVLVHEDFGWTKEFCNIIHAC